MVIFLIVIAYISFILVTIVMIIIAGPEYGTTLGAWRGVLTEADHVAELHTVMAERMMSDVYGSIKVWQKENYHKSMMHFKETKEFEDGFRKVNLAL